MTQSAAPTEAVSDFCVITGRLAAGAHELFETTVWLSTLPPVLSTLLLVATGAAGPTASLGIASFL